MLKVNGGFIRKGRRPLRAVHNIQTIEKKKKTNEEKPRGTKRHARYYSRNGRQLYHRNTFQKIFRVYRFLSTKSFVIIGPERKNNRLKCTIKKRCKIKTIVLILE